MKALLITIMLSSGVFIYAQGRKMPDFSFKHNSIEFANSNRAYNDQAQYTDTIADEKILVALLNILNDNESLIIQVVGHTALNEDTIWGQKRADTIAHYLIKNGIDSTRVLTRNLANRKPIISEAIIESLPTEVEVQAAHQKNRRVEIKVAGIRKEEE